MAFTVPGADGKRSPAPLLPEKIASDVIEPSVVAFEQQLRAELGAFASIAPVAKFVANYRAEVTRVAVEVWRRRGEHGS